MIRQKREQNLGNIFRGSRMRFHSNDSKMFRQRQYDPIAKMSIERNQRSLRLYGPFKNQRIVSACLAGLGRTDDIMPGFAQKQREFDPKHLIEVEAHGGLRRIKGGDFRVQHGLPGVLQDGLNIGPCQFGVTAQQGIPRFTIGQLFQDGGDRNSCVFDDRLAATDARIDFNPLIHALNDTCKSLKSQVPGVVSRWTAIPLRR